MTADDYMKFCARPNCFRLALPGKTTCWFHHLDEANAPPVAAPASLPDLSGWTPDNTAVVHLPSDAFDVASASVFLNAIHADMEAALGVPVTHAVGTDGLGPMWETVPVSIGTTSDAPITHAAHAAAMDDWAWLVPEVEVQRRIAEAVAAERARWQAHYGVEPPDPQAPGRAFAFGRLPTRTT